MNNEQVMLAAIRACATTVEELVQTVTALPAKLARQLEEVRQGVAVALREHAAGTAKALGDCDALRADMAELAGGVTARLDAFATAQAETRQIIADNQAAMRGVETSIDSLRGDIAKDVTTVAERIEAVRIELGEGSTALAERVVEQASQLFNLNAELPKVKTELAEQVAAVQQQLERTVTEAQQAEEKLRASMQGAVESVAKDLRTTLVDEVKVVNDNLEASNKLREVLENRIETIHTGMGEVVSGVGKRVDEAFGAIAEVQTNVLQRMQENDEGVLARIRGVENIATQTENRVCSVQNIVVDDRKHADEQAAELRTYVEESASKAAGRIEILQHAVQRNEEAHAELVGTVAEIRAGNDVSREGILGRIDDVEKQVEGLGGKLQEQVTSATHKLASDLSIGLGDVNARIDAVESQAEGFATAKMLTEHSLALGEKIDVASKTALSNLELTSQSINERLGTFFENATQQNANLGEEFKAMVAPLQDDVKTLADDIRTIGKSVDGRVEAVLSIVDKNDEAIREDLAGVNTRITEESQGVGDLRKTLAELGTQFSNLRVDLKDGLADANESVETVKAVFANTTKALETELLHAIKKADETLREHVSKAMADDTEQLQKLYEAAINNTEELRKQNELFFEGADERFAEFAAKHTGTAEELTALRKEVEVSIQGHIEKLLKAMEEVPVGISPEDMAELQVRNAAMVDAQIGTALANMRVETEYADGKVSLVAVMPKHDGTESRSTVDIPVEIGVKYRGVYLEKEAYSPGDLVSHKGSMWIAKSNTAGEPGDDITGWTLAVKRGNHGRDGFSTKTYDKHEERNVYREGDFLRWANRLWQARKETRQPPDASEITSTATWSLIGGLL